MNRNTCELNHMLHSRNLCLILQFIENNPVLPSYMKCNTPRLVFDHTTQNIEVLPLLPVLASPEAQIQVRHLAKNVTEMSSGGLTHLSFPA